MMVRYEPEFERLAYNLTCPPFDLTCPPFAPPRNTAAMGGSFDALANPEGYSGVGPGSLATGIVVKEEVVEEGGGGKGEEKDGDGGE